MSSGLVQGNRSFRLHKQQRVARAVGNFPKLNSLVAVIASKHRVGSGKRKVAAVGRVGRFAMWRPKDGRHVGENFFISLTVPRLVKFVLLVEVLSF